jgi:hypothetical protein
MNAHEEPTAGEFAGYSNCTIQEAERPRILEVPVSMLLQSSADYSTRTVDPTHQRMTELYSATTPDSSQILIGNHRQHALRTMWSALSLVDQMLAARCLVEADSDESDLPSLVIQTMLI